MTNIGNLSVAFEAETGSFETAVKKVGEQANRSARKMRENYATVSKSVQGMQGDIRRLEATIVRSQSQAQSSFGSTQRSVMSLGSAIGNVTSALGVGFSVAAIVQAGKEFVRIADDINKLQGRVQSITQATGDFSGVWAELQRISASTGADLNANVGVFQRLQMSARDLGKSNADILQLVEGVAQLGRIGGSSSQQLADGMLQFGQALSSGKVQADEFRGIIDNIPALADKIATGLGVTTGELIRMVKDGKLTSQQLFDSVFSQLGRIQTEFGKMPSTVDQATNRMGLAFKNFIDVLDDTTKFTPTVAAGINSMANALDGLAIALIDPINGFRMLGLEAQRAMKIASINTKTMKTGGPSQKVGIQKLPFGLDFIQGLGRFLPGADPVNMPTKADQAAIEKAIAKVNSDFDKQQNDIRRSVYGGKPSRSSSRANPPRVDPIGSGSGGGRGRGGGGGGRGRSSRATTTVAKAIEEQKDLLKNLEDQIRSRNISAWEEYAQKAEEANKVLRAGKVELSDYLAYLDNIELDLNRAVASWSLWTEITSKLDEKIGKPTSEFAASLENSVKAPVEVKDDSTAAIEEIALAARNFGREFEDTFVNALTTGKFAFRDFAASALADLSRIILRLTVIEPIAAGLKNAFTGSASGGGTGAATSAVGSGIVGFIKGLFRAEGGPVNAGKPYIVGERGPELFVPGASGNVVPNNQLGAGGGQQVVYQTIIINATDAESFRALLKREGNLIGSFGLQAVQQAENKRGRRGPLDRG